MKQLLIPLIDRRVWMYWGEKGWTKWRKHVEECGGDLVGQSDEAPIGAAGRTWGGVTWVTDRANVGLVVHELSHLTDNVMESIGSDDPELRAHILGWLAGRLV